MLLVILITLFFLDPLYFNGIAWIIIGKRDIPPPSPFKELFVQTPWPKTDLCNNYYIWWLSILNGGEGREGGWPQSN